MITRLLKDTAEQDFFNFEHYSETHATLVTVYKRKELFSKFQRLYELHYALYNMVISIMNNAKDPHLLTAVSFIQESLVSSIDLINLEHFKSAKKEYRSLIESIFRLALACSRSRIYEDRKKQHLYKSTDILSALLSKLDTHKIGSLTHFTVDYYSNTILKSDVTKLNEYYSEFSNVTHTNNVHETNFVLNLESMSYGKSAYIQKDLDSFVELLGLCLSVSYFSIINYYGAEILHQQDFYFILKLMHNKKFEEHFIEISRVMGQRFIS